MKHYQLINSKITVTYLTVGQQQNLKYSPACKPRDADNRIARFWKSTVWLLYRKLLPKITSNYDIGRDTGVTKLRLTLDSSVTNLKDPAG